jgi:acyl transferase domain-containing protein/acyl carrier protein
VKSIAEIQAWLVARIAGLLEIPPGTIDINEPFDHYGVSSLEIVALSGDLEEWLGRRLPPSLIYDHPTIMKLSRHLAEDKDGQSNPNPNQHPANQSSTDEPIAVIGISCRFPGADDPEAFWELLQAGKDCISEIPPDRWNKEAFFNPDPSVPGKSISNWGGFLDQVDVFDPFFFGISPAEAKKMDPQQRLLLELSFEALDDAGLVKEELADSDTGVFVGISVNEYSQYQFGDPTEINGHSGTGSALSIAANRLSYFYDFKGPSMALDTACSSSLSAVHLACQSLRNGECGMALAGGANIILSPVHSIAFTKAGVLAPDGRCKTFDARANGYVRGEGGGLIVLKPLSAAQADGDPIHALILGSTMKQDGRTNGLMAPSQEAQETMLREACRKAMVAPENIQYVEAHGTGTLLGDSIEAEALGTVMGQNRRQFPCLIGSVKSNIGHLESAAGIAGLIKVILSIRHRSLPPSVHFQTPNPHIPFDELNLEVNAKSRPWPQPTVPLLAGVSSFGFGGTIVHAIIRDAVEAPSSSAISPETELKTDNLQLLPLSANSPEGLDKLAATFMNLLTSSTSVSVSDICYAASSRRSKYNLRLVAKGNSREELYSALESFLHREPASDLFLVEQTSNHHPKLVFLFPGHVGQ